MTDQAEPGRPPAHDLAAFDLTKRSPEQLAQSFARWKAQRKRPPEEARGAQPLQPQPSATTVADPAPEEAPKASKRTKSLEYSATFSALLEAGSEPTVQRPDPAPIAPRPAPKPDASSGRRLKAMSILAGAASLVALGAGALLELSHRPDTSGAKPVAAHPHQVPAAPIAAAATKAPTAAWRLQRTVDLALMKAAPAADMARPMPPTAEPPAIQTASKAASAASKPVRSEPASRKAASETALFVAKPFIPNDAAAAQEPAMIPATPVAVRSGDPRPDALFQQRRDRSTSASDRVASGSKPAEATGARSNVEVPSAATARGKVASGGSGDPRGEGSGGARAGSAVNGKTSGANADTDGGEAAATDGGSASSGAGSADAGSGDSDTGGSGTSGNGSGGSAAGSDGTGGDAAGGAGSSGDGDAESGDGEDSGSGGVGGAIGGALGAVGDALGDALGGGKGNPDSNDKDQRN